MNANVRASKRKMKMKDESSTIHAPKKWSEDDIEKYLHCIMENGHKNFEKLQECFPDKSLEVIKTFLRTTFDTAIRREDGHPTLDGWINHCKGMTDEPAWKDSVQIARAIKYLSVDGLIENHPLPSHCQGVNFA